MTKNHRYIRFLLQLILQVYHVISTWICWMMMTIILHKVPYVDPTNDDSDQKNENCITKTKKIDDGTTSTDTDCKSATWTDTNPSLQTQWDDVLRILFPTSSSSSSSSSTSTGITILPYHIEQLHHWDCGVTCLQMIFSWLFISDDSNHNHNDMRNDKNITTSHDLREWMIETIQTESIWTIDLIYLLHEFCQQHQQREKLSEQMDNIGTFRNDDRNSNYSKFTFVMMTKSSLFVNHDDISIKNINERHEMHNDKLDDCYYIHLPYYKDTFVQDRVRIQQRLQQMAAIHDHRNDNNEHHINSDYCVPTMIHNRIYQVPTGTTTSSSFLSINQIIHCIQHENCVAIALVDNTIFASTFSTTAIVTRSCTTASVTTVPSTDTTNAKPKHGSTNHNNHAYVGHYIIIVGISYDIEHVQKASLWTKSTKNDNNSSSMLLVPSERYATNENGSSTLHPNNESCCLVTYNPANRSSSHSNSTTTPEYVSITHFERAWRAYGTDDDIIFIAKQ